MTSRPSGKIAADANVLLSAAVNGAARKETVSAQLAALPLKKAAVT